MTTVIVQITQLKINDEERKFRFDDKNEIMTAKKVYDVIKFTDPTADIKKVICVTYGKGYYDEQSDDNQAFAYLEYPTGAGDASLLTLLEEGKKSIGFKSVNAVGEQNRWIFQKYTETRDPRVGSRLSIQTHFFPTGMSQEEINTTMFGKPPDIEDEEDLLTPIMLEDSFRDAYDEILFI
jgi:hypothetical protein